VTNRRLAPGAPYRGSVDNGSAAAEYAIVLPVLLLLLFIMVTLSSVFFDQLHLQSAARDSARAGSVNIANACSTAQSSLSGNNVGSLTCSTVTTCSSGAVKMSLVAVKPYSIPLLGNRSVTLRATSTFVCPQ
jgi:Flp pilus assembly protein TadG